MKCLSLWQPWASLLASGKKLAETRGWAIRHRGPLLVHAAKTWNGELATVSKSDPFAAALRSLGVMWSDRGRPALPFGAVVGRVDVIACYPTAKVTFDHAGLDPVNPVEATAAYLRLWHEQKAFGDFSEGRYAFLCANPILFAEPIPLKGAQGLFDVPLETRAAFLQAA